MTTGTNWALERGAMLVGRDAVRFSVWAPRAARVSVRVRRADAWEDAPLERDERGVFSALVAGVGAGADYRFRLDDARDLPDPVSRSQPDGVHGPSRVVDPARFRWTDGDWKGQAMADFIIYELHVGTFTDAGTFGGVAEHLAALATLGVTAIELMPVAQFPGERNWGYDGVHPYAPQNSYGGPDGLRALVNAAHAAGLAVALDIVPNHLGPEGNYLDAYGPYFSDAYRTPWGRPINFDGPQSDEVRRYFIDLALYWITEFHIDALRLDAVHAIHDFSARHILAELARAVHAEGAQLGRQTLVIGESDLNDARLLRPPEVGGYGLDAQWSDDFHHAVHVALTGERHGYYSDFGGTWPIAKALAERFVYDGRPSAHRQRRHGAPGMDVSADHFVIAIQNHDQVGNRASGDRLSTLASFEQLKLAAALLLLAAYVPLLFMGEEYGETNPFLYFVSHGDPALVDAVRTGRREEFASFGWSGEVPDPQSEDTFLRSTLDRAHARRPEGAALNALYRDLLRLRREEPALRPGDAETIVRSDDETRWISMQLAHDAGSTLLALFNLADRSNSIPVPTMHHVTAWQLVLATSQRPYVPDAPVATSSASEEPPLSTATGDTRVTLPPFAAVLYRSVIGPPGSH